MPSIPSRAARCLVVGFVVLLFPSPSRATVRYAVSLAQREQNLFHVTMSVPNVDRELVVAMPVWNALYQVRDFAHRVERLQALDREGKPLAVSKSDPQTWHVQASGTVTLDYLILWDEPSPFNSDVNSSHAFLNFAEVLLYVPSRRNEEVLLNFDDVPAAWRIAVALDHAGPPADARASFIAPSYDALVDAPAELGPFEQFSIEAGKAQIDVAVHAAPPGLGGKLSWSREQLTEQIRRIVVTETALMRDIPFRRFLFIYHFGIGGGGGMEHSNSTAISLAAGADAAGVTAHEFFHLWNVKRIRPQCMEPVDFSREQPCDALWFAEGVTSTFGAYTLLRSGLWSREQFFSDLGGEIESLAARPAHEWQSAQEASLNAWFEKYPLYRRGSLSISYYNKGQLLGLLLDILLRENTANRAGLDDLLRDLNARYAKQGQFYENSAGLRAAAERLAGPAARQNLEDFFRRYVSGTDELPMADFLARAGLELRVTDRLMADAGFIPAPGAFHGPSEEASAPVLVTQVIPGGPAGQAGLRRGDRIVAVDHKPVPPDLRAWLESRSPGEVVRLRIRRGDEDRDISFTLGRRVEKNYAVREDSRAKGKSTLAGRIREGILTGATDP